MSSRSLHFMTSRTLTLPPNSRASKETLKSHIVSDGLYKATARTSPRLFSMSFTRTYSSLLCCTTYACSPNVSWFNAINSLFLSNAKEGSGIVVISQPISSGELIIHHIPKCTSSSSGFKPRPTSSISISL